VSFALIFQAIENLATNSAKAMFSLSPPPPRETPAFFPAHRLEGGFMRTPKDVHAPQTPSPLRTSRNVNLMPFSRAFSRSGNGTDNGSEKNDETLLSSPLGKFSATGLGHNDENQTPAGKMGDVHTDKLITPPDSSHRSAVSFSNSTGGPSSFHFSLDHQKPQTDQTWETRFRDNGAAASLARHATQQREHKKTQFLDRIRRRRDDGRSELIGDQVLRMDFVRERRRWEDEMKRRALEAGQADMDMEEVEEEFDQQPWMSPTEEHDFDGFVDETGGHNLQGDDRDDEFVIDDDEYEELFREILSQDQSTNVAGDRSTERLQQQQDVAYDQHQTHDSGDRRRYDSSMDLS
jgi:hypothetical protein